MSAMSLVLAFYKNKVKVAKHSYQTFTFLRHFPLIKFSDCRNNDNKLLHANKLSDLIKCGSQEHVYILNTLYIHIFITS